MNCYCADCTNPNHGTCGCTDQGVGVLVHRVEAQSAQIQRLKKHLRDAVKLLEEGQEIDGAGFWFEGDVKPFLRRVRVYDIMGQE